MSEAHAAPQEAFARDFLAGAAFLARSVAAKVLQPPPEIDLNRWAVDNLVLGSQSPFPGRYDPNRFPFFAEILAACGPEDATRIIVLVGSAQIGKTLLAMIFVAASLDLDPCQLMYIHPTEPNATRFGRTKWRPLIGTVPRLKEILETRQSKEGGNSTLYQERKDGRGSITLSGANSAASLSMVTVKRQVQDDLAKWETNPAGDPEAQADSRSKAFTDAKILKLSTPLLAGSCRITRAYKAGTQHHFHVPCPHCNHRQPLEPENMIATIEAEPEHPGRAHFTCAACNGKIEERHRKRIVERGSWVAHNPGSPNKSFWIWAAYAPLEPWERIARGYLDAKDDPHSEQTWWNDTAGRPYELPGEAPPWRELKDRADQRGRQAGLVPQGAILLTLAMDVQDDYVDGAVYGWGADLHGWFIARIRVDGHIANPETRAALNRLVEFEWPTIFGTKRKVDLAGIDAGAWTDDVLDWASGWPKSRVIMLRGVAGDTTPTLTQVRRERRPDGRPVKYQGRFFNVGINGLKGALYKFLRIEEPEARGFLDYPAGLDDDFYEQLTAEKRTPVVGRLGITSYQWIKPRGARNEQLDVAVYSLALAWRLGWRIMHPRHWERLRVAREPEHDPNAPPPEHAAEAFWGDVALPNAATVLPPPERASPPQAPAAPPVVAVPARPATPAPTHPAPQARRRVVIRSTFGGRNR